MPELIVIRHAQASFGAADYDVLSPLGHRQSAALGSALKRQGVTPDAVFIGGQKRHAQTLEGLDLGLTPQVHEGLNEFDFNGLLAARFHEQLAPEGLYDDRRTHFRALRETVLAWQRDEIAAPPEPWDAFAARVMDARDAMLACGGTCVLAVSSGGAIGQMIAATLGAPPAQMIALQLQIRNAAVSRFFGARGAVYLTGFNETPHVDAANVADLQSYS